MLLTRLIYASKVTDGVNEKDLTQIIQSAEKNNSSMGVTGILIFSNKYFMQALEGGTSAVNSIYHRILKDERHHEPTIIDYSEIDKRIFEEWKMKLFYETKINRQTILKHSPDENFDPYDFKGKSAIAFLQEIANSLR